MDEESDLNVHGDPKDLESPTVNFEVAKQPLLCSTRFAMSILLAFGVLMFFMERVNLSVAIVCMVNHTAVHGSEADESRNDSVSSGYCNASKSTQKLMDGSIVWSRQLQGIILSSFYWGYVITCIPGGWLAGRFGAKPVLFGCIFGGSLVTLFLPLASANTALFIALEATLGFLHGGFFSAVHCFLYKWAPIKEKASLTAITFSAQLIGILLSNIVSGFLCVYGFAGGWPSIFYLIGSAGIFWSIMWLLFSANDPEDYRWISEKERQYITEFRSKAMLEKNRSVPWLRIFTSKAMWAINVVHSCFNFGLYALMANMPTYLRDSLKFNIQTSGSLWGVAFFGEWILWLLTGIIAQKLHEMKIRVVIIRKIFNTMGMTVPAICLTCITFVTCESKWVAAMLLVIGVSCIGFMSAGFLVNYGDIAPPYAGVLFGVSNTLATISGLLGPFVIGFMTQTNSMNEWRTVFNMAAAVLTFGAIFFLIFGSDKIQDWAYPEVAKDIEIKMGEEDEDVKFIEQETQS